LIRDRRGDSNRFVYGQASVCDGFAGEYWRVFHRQRAYPSAFLEALTQAGFLAEGT
jgi:hypothetical protein